jgi:hypothetical protein
VFTAVNLLLEPADTSDTTANGAGETMRKHTHTTRRSRRREPGFGSAKATDQNVNSQATQLLQTSPPFQASLSSGIDPPSVYHVGLPIFSGERLAATPSPFVSKTDVVRYSCNSERRLLLCRLLKRHTLCLALCLALCPKRFALQGDSLSKRQRDPVDEIQFSQSCGSRIWTARQTSHFRQPSSFRPGWQSSHFRLAYLHSGLLMLLRKTTRSNTFTLLDLTPTPSLRTLTSPMQTSPTTCYLCFFNSIMGSSSFLARKQALIFRSVTMTPRYHVGQRASLLHVVPSTENNGYPDVDLFFQVHVL